MTILQLLIGALTLVTNAFFVGAEFALISVRRSQVEPLAAAGDRRARRVIWGLEHVSAVLATAQLGITVSSLVLGVVAEPAIAHLMEPVFEAVNMPDGAIHPVSFALALALATYLHMLIGEMIPKNLALAAPARTAMLLGPGLVAMTRALRPVIFTINTLANGILRLLRVEPKDEVNAAFTGDQLTRMVDEARDTGLLDEDESELLRDALALGERPVSEVVLPLHKMVQAPADVTPRMLERLAVQSGYSRFPVVRDDGAVLGYLHVKDALETDDRDTPFGPAALRPVTTVAADTRLDDVLTSMRHTAAHLAAVTESGRLIGVVTMADVLKELVGRTHQVR
ncbi:hemolysin family protein [Yinghuangia soli]|uniref:Hemolysin family protein n=1 Tax=Yinghuangia soli TaxID=2908204 RepID=A0AA41QAD8_9ACTN|nr:hemolysin family protein [Yinghuangia soli]MCF2533676.1 hemolysin family protein [Yinghuangia soli]